MLAQLPQLLSYGLTDRLVIFFAAVWVICELPESRMWAAWPISFVAGLTIASFSFRPSSFRTLGDNASSKVKTIIDASKRYNASDAE